MAGKITVGILFGGNSVEHKISLLSAKNVISAIDKNKFNVVLIGIDQDGRWLYHDDAEKYLLEAHDPKLVRLNKSNKAVAFLPGTTNSQLTSVSDPKISSPKIDVVFPILHGQNGEDGTIQGLLRLANIPFVGADVASSAICMDKDICKRLLRDAGLPIANFIAIHAHEKDKYNFKTLANLLGAPFFIKPANSGSSVGISKVKSEHNFDKQYDDAFRFDDKILIEQAIVGKEIECAVLGNEDPVASIPGEIIPTHEFYSYEAKYLDQNGAKIVIPANLPEAVIRDVRALAVKTFKVLGCSGLARVDFFATDSGELYINEVNTMPGFTNISMYPKMWETSGITYVDLIEKLIRLALDRGAKRKQLLTQLDSASDRLTLDVTIPIVSENVK